MMSEAQAKKIILGLIKAEESGDYKLAPVFLGPYTAFITVSALQVARRHPAMAPELKSLIERIGRDIQSLYPGPPAELLEDGWVLPS